MWQAEDADEADPDRLAALCVLAGCHKNQECADRTTSLMPAESQGVENGAGSDPAGPTAVEGASGVGTTGVEEPIERPLAPDTPTE